MATRTEPAIDLLDPLSFEGGQPHEAFRWLREHDPVHRHAERDGPGFWVVTCYEDVRDVGRDPETFSSEPTIMIPDGSGELDLGDDHGMMLTMDPPRHTRYRRLVQPEFSNRMVRDIRPRIEELAARIIDAVIERGECDLVEDVAGELPSFIIADMLGIPLDDGRELYKLTETIHADPDTVGEGAGMQAVIEMFNYAHGVREEKLREPADDLSSLLAHAEIDGERLDEIDFNLFFLLLVDAGGDTTRNLVGGGMHALFEHPDERRRLAGDLDGLLAPATEELLRYVSPVVYMRRTATRDTTLRGREISEGDKVVMYYGAANRDPDVFDDPERLDLSRDPNPHLAFGGGGPHFCLGAPLARIEIQAMLREIFTRMPDVEPAGPTEWLRSTFICGPSHIPVRFTPGPLRA